MFLENHSHQQHQYQLWMWILCLLKEFSQIKCLNHLIIVVKLLKIPKNIGIIQTKTVVQVRTVLLSLLRLSKVKWKESLIGQEAISQMRYIRKSIIQVLLWKQLNIIIIIIRIVHLSKEYRLSPQFSPLNNSKLLSNRLSVLRLRRGWIKSIKSFHSIHSHLKYLRKIDVMCKEKRITTRTTAVSVTSNRLARIKITILTIKLLGKTIPWQITIGS